MNVDDDALAFFNRLSGRLVIQLSAPPRHAAPHLLNLVATPSARIKSVRMTFSVFEDDDARELTDTEWSRVVVRAPCVCMRSADTDDVVVDHDAPNGSAFTVRDLAAVIAKTEHESRERGSWMGGVDVHHVYFEGIELEDGHDEPS